jgi:hypothetical protein
VKTFQKLLFRHSKTLTTLNVFLFPKKEKLIPTLRQVRLPCLPYLKTLVITSSGNLNKNTAHWELDIFNVRSLFRVSFKFLDMKPFNKFLFINRITNYTKFYHRLTPSAFCFRGKMGKGSGNILFLTKRFRTYLSWPTKLNTSPSQ